MPLNLLRKFTRTFFHTPLNLLISLGAPSKRELLTPVSLVGSAERLFERGAARDNDTEHQVKELHAKIGQLTMERDCLSGKLGH